MYGIARVTQWRIEDHDLYLVLFKSNTDTFLFYGDATVDQH